MAGSSFAQISTGGIRGIVKDATGAVLVGVTVEAESPARIGGAAIAITNGQGLYQYNADTFTDARNNSSDTGDADFGQSLAVVAPRRAMIGIRFEF